MDLFIYILVTWRLTSLFVNEAGPFKVFTHLRKRVYLFTCFWCFSVWIGTALALLYTGFRPSFNIVLYALCFSAGSIFLEEALERLRKV